MAKKIHYEDNIFFITSMIKTLKSGMTLDIDPEFFIDKSIEDFFFIDSALSRIFASLKANPYLLKRAEHLRALLRAKKVFNDFTDEILSDKLPFAENLKPFFGKFEALRAEHMQDITEIHAMLDTPQVGNEPEEDVITATEYHFLFDDEEDSTEETE